MNNDNGAAADCASFAIMVKGFAGSLGAAKACLGCESVPQGIREELWKRLRGWAVGKLEEYGSSEPLPGIYRMLWDIGSKGYGFRVGVRSIPLEQEAVEICEILGSNIYEMESADMELGLYEYPFPDEMILIGHAAKGRDKLLVNGEDISFLNKPAI